MSSLDRAFIRAYGDAPTARAVVAPPPLRPAPQPVAEAVIPLPPERQAKSEAPAAAPFSSTVGDIWERNALSSAAPLSTFSGVHAAHESFRALLEVDHLVWPEICDHLVALAEDSWQAFVDSVVDQISAGAKRIAIGGCRRGEGRTSVALTTCKLLAARGLHGVIVDADLENPVMARACGIAAPTGWGDVLDGRLPLGEALISSARDFVTLMPWHGPARKLPQITAELHAASAFSLLADHFDFVILDAPPLAGTTSVAEFADFLAALEVDSLYLVRDIRHTPREQLADIGNRLRLAGIGVRGIVENFAATEATIPTTAG